MSHLLDAAATAYQLHWRGLWQTIALLGALMLAAGGWGYAQHHYRSALRDRARRHQRARADKRLVDRERR
jgi:hypothetical protein